MKEKKIKIKIFAVVSRGEGDEAEREKIRITGNGVMTCEGNRIEIRYDEILGEDGPAVNTLSSSTINVTREMGLYFPVFSKPVMSRPTKNCSDKDSVTSKGDGVSVFIH